MKKNFTLLSDVAYGSHERHKVDILIPEKVKYASGVILFVHGGGWTDGDKTAHRTDAEFFCNLGYISATMNYRYVTDELNVFDELDDITAALKAIKNECADRGYNTQKLIISGGSAGGHLALLYAYTRKEESPIPPVAACVYCPPADCTKENFLMGISGEFENWKYEVLSKGCGCRMTKENFLNEEQQSALKKISPEVYVTPDCVPTAIFHGRHDELVPFEHIVTFIGLLSAAGVKNDLLIYENSGHMQDKDPETALQAKGIIKDYAEMYFGS